VVTPPRGGLHVWVELPDVLDDVEVAERARARRLVVGAGRPYFVSEPPGSRLRPGSGPRGDDRRPADLTGQGRRTTSARTAPSCSRSGDGLS
jgi:hypothetical protein